MTWREIAQLFERLELELVASLRRNLAAHRAWEEEEGFAWPAWQAEKLANIERFRRQNQAIMAEYTPQIDEETRRLLEEQFAEGARGPDAAGQPTEKNFFGVNPPRLESLIQDMRQVEQDVQSAALRLTDDVYRKTILRAETALAAGATTLPKAIDQAMEDFLAQGINCIEYKNGRRVNMADYAQMALRTAATRSYLQGEAARRAEQGVDTVLVSQYGACSKTCLPWQGRVYIDDVWGDFQGERAGERGRSRNGKWYPLLSAAVRGGLFHPNCRHTLSTWYEGISTRPEPLDGAKVRETAALEAEQRRLERAVRKWKRLAAGLQQPEAAARAKREVRGAQRELREFIRRHDVLRRDPWREKVYGEPVAHPEKDSIMLLSEKERWAVNSYISGGSYSLNAKLREGLPLTPMEQDLVQNLDTALRTMPTYQGTVYRSLMFEDAEKYADFLRQHKDQSYVSYNAYTSSSTKKDYHDVPTVLLEIHSVTGRDLRMVNQGEQEVIFERGKTFKVTAVSRERDCLVIKLEE